MDIGQYWTILDNIGHAVLPHIRLGAMKVEGQREAQQYLKGTPRGKTLMKEMTDNKSGMKQDVEAFRGRNRGDDPAKRETKPTEGIMKQKLTGDD